MQQNEILEEIMKQVKKLPVEEQRQVLEILKSMQFSNKCRDERVEKIIYSK